MKFSKLIRGLTFLIAPAIFILLSPGGAAAAEKYVLDPPHSGADFSVRHMVITNVKGGFSDISGVIVLDDQDITRSSVDVTIKAASIYTNNEKRDDHLRSADFLDVQKFPDITFKSTSIRKTNDGLVMTGLLTIRDVSKEVSFPFEMTDKIVDPWGNTRFGAEGTLEIDRRDYGLNWNKALETGGVLVGNEVGIDLNIQAMMEK